jgi:hypothetical protein
MEGQFNSIIQKFENMRKSIQNNIADVRIQSPKVYTFEEIMQKEEEMNSRRHEYINDFFEYMEDLFGEVYDFVDLSEIKAKLKDIEGLLNPKNRDSSYYDNIIKNLKELQEEIKGLSSEKTTRDGVNKLKSLTYQLKCYSDKILFEQFHKDRINVPMSHKKLLYSERRIQELQSAIYIDRSKQKEEGLKIIESDIPLTDRKRYKVTKYKKFLAKNFLQVFYIKENGIFANSYFSNCDINAFSSYKKYKFYKVKFCLSKTDSTNSIKNHIEYVKTLFSKFILFYIENPNKKFIKTVICGIGKKQNIMKASLKKYLRNDIKNDSLIKISCFTNIYSSIIPSLKKYNNNYHSTNLSENLYNKLITMLKY